MNGRLESTRVEGTDSERPPVSMQDKPFAGCPGCIWLEGTWDRVLYKPFEAGARGFVGATDCSPQCILENTGVFVKAA